MKEINTYSAMQTNGILLNANESYKNINQAIIDEISEAIKTMPFNRYPEDDYTKLMESYGKYINKSKDELLVGNGSDDMLGLIIGLTMNEGKKLYTLSKDFGMYDYYCSMHNGEVLKYDWKMNEEFDVNDFINIGKQNNVNLILFSNPNNPTGRYVKKEDIIKIVEAFKDIYVVIDEAYADFCEDTMLGYIDTYPNLLITRTLSKAFALAGIRVGFLVACKETMAKLKPYKVPYNVNRFSELAAIIALNYYEDVKKDIEVIKEERDFLFNKVIDLNKEGFVLYPSCTNYLYGKCDRKDDFFNLLKENDVTIRDYANTDTFRITIGSHEQNELLYNIIKNY